MESDRKTLITMLAFAGDFICWGVGMTFAGQTTVMPTFVRHFTDSPILIGLVSTIQMGGFLLPQLLVSNLIAHRERKKPFMLAVGLFYRPIFWLLALFLVVSRGQDGALILTVFYLLFTAFNLGDAVATVPWFDIMGKSVPPSRRGRMMGSAQIIMGLLAIGAGQVVKAILSPDGPGFPFNYALCFAIAGTGAMVAWGWELFIYEAIQPVSENRLPLREYLPVLWRVLRHDANFTRLTAVRLLAGMANMALPFYIIFATDQLKFPPESVGLFVSAQVAGTVLAGSVLGFLSERSGSRAVIIASLTLQTLAPALALFLFFTGLTSGAFAPWLYAVVFVAIGVGQSSGILGFINYVLELAPPQERVTYVGLTNTLSGVLLIAPLVGALLIDYFSFTGMFVVVLAVLVGSLLMSMRLIEPRGMYGDYKVA
ncbi:MAG: MFS transporter [Chloroflexi bacterium]|nr:MFS transporter [Chloroflexota bacterium]